MSVEAVRSALGGRLEAEALPTIVAQAGALPPGEAMDLARTALKRRWHRAAIALAAVAIDAQPVEALLAMADSQLVLRDWEAARRSAEAVLATRGHAPAALMRLVRAHRGAGHLKAAAAAARQWTTRVPKSADAFAEAARIAAAMSEDREALAAAARACELRPADEEMHVLALKSAEALGARDALVFHAQALARRSPRMLGRLAAAWVRMGKTTAAVALCEALLDAVGPAHEVRRDVTIVCGLLIGAGADRLEAEARVAALAARMKG